MSTLREERDTSFRSSVGSSSGDQGESTRRHMIRQKVQLNRDLSTCSD